jgi:O-acetyl-ADP-ribose deacetylase (regulator of RNase III)
MIEMIGNLWSFHVSTDARVITTNGDVNGKGRAVMGRGVASQAAGIFPRIKWRLGELLLEKGNIVHKLDFDRYSFSVVTFPVKEHYYQQARLELIERSAQQLYDLANEHSWNKIILPRPGCGNGGLKWQTVKPIIDWLDDRFMVVNNDRNA